MLASRTPNRARWFTTVLLLGFAGLAFALQDPSDPSVTPSTSDPAGIASPAQAPIPTQPPASNIARNFSEWTKQGGWVMYPIYIVFILGAGVVIYEFLRIYFDKHNAKPILPFLEKHLHENFPEAEQDSKVYELMENLGPNLKSHLAKLLNKLGDLWQRDKSAPVLQVEIDSYLNGMKEKYEVGRSFAMLLSDTAGALGLLGTVLGMYQTFMPGKLESTQIISGMGVALVTTIGGLIVSIILNFGISWAHSAFHRHLDWLAEFADGFRNRFGHGQTVKVSGLNVNMPAYVPQAAPGTTSEEEGKPAQPALRRVPAHMRILSGNNQSAEAGAALAKALEVAVADQYGEPMPHVGVVFEANGSMITFDNGDSVQAVQTDFIGRAKVHARLGKLIGRHKILARVNGEASLLQEFEIEGRHGLPDRLIVLSGHLQLGPPNAMLSEHLSLRLEDPVGNPVPDQTVVFEVTHNNGRVESDKPRVEARTDEEGVASVAFRLGDTPGANIVRAWVKSKSARKLETTFESMGRE